MSHHWEAGSHLDGACAEPLKREDFGSLTPAGLLCLYLRGCSHLRASGDASTEEQLRRERRVSQRFTPVSHPLPAPQPALPAPPSAPPRPRYHGSAGPAPPAAATTTRGVPPTAPPPGAAIGPCAARGPACPAPSAALGGLTWSRPKMAAALLFWWIISARGRGRGAGRGSRGAAPPPPVVPRRGAAAAAEARAGGGERPGGGGGAGCRRARCGAARRGRPGDALVRRPAGQRRQESASSELPLGGGRGKRPPSVHH